MEKLSQYTVFFVDNAITIKFGYFGNFIVRNFVVVWEAPTRWRPCSSVYYRRSVLLPL